MVIKQAELDIVCGVTSKLPDTGMPEVAFAGKSNVGKSSLINGLMNRKALARTSGQPGKTQTINFYKVNREMYLVDLPGYGYARVSQAEKEKWGKMIEKYLHTSKNLKAVFLLIDIRHEPSANDRQMYEWILHNGYDPIRPVGCSVMDNQSCYTNCRGCSEKSVGEGCAMTVSCGKGQH